MTQPSDISTLDENLGTDAQPSPTKSKAPVGAKTEAAKAPEVSETKSAPGVKYVGPYDVREINGVVWNGKDSVVSLDQLDEETLAYAREADEFEVTG